MCTHTIRGPLRENSLTFRHSIRADSIRCDPTLVSQFYCATSTFLTLSTSRPVYERTFARCAHPSPQNLAPLSDCYPLYVGLRLQFRRTLRLHRRESEATGNLHRAARLSDCMDGRKALRLFCYLWGTAMGTTPLLAFICGGREKRTIRCSLQRWGNAVGLV